MASSPSPSPPTSVVFLLLVFLCSSFPLLLISDGSRITATLHDLASLSFEEGYTQLFGDRNLVVRDGKKVHLSLDERTGAGFASQDFYLNGYFSASIKLPSDYAAGVVVAFYLSNGDLYHKNHDEIDFEFLGNVRGREWRVQTNVYGNGSTGVGREERYNFPFDPTEDFHQYSILWSNERIIFYIDDLPIREVVKSSAMRGDFPLKPMSLYVTIWDGSNWATSGGRYKVNYKYAPYVAEFTDLILHGCIADPTDHTFSCDKTDSDRYNTIKVSPSYRSAMESFRRKYMTYSYCYDRQRYQKALPECSTNLREAEHLKGRTHHAKGSHRAKLIQPI